jgi:hypothetical protein
MEETSAARAGRKCGAFRYRVAIQPREWAGLVVLLLNLIDDIDILLLECRDP